jgi:subtilisin family serine protease
MAVRLCPTVIDALMLGAENKRRQLQDFPVLGDVWACYAEHKQGQPPPDLLIVPIWEKSAVDVADLLEDHRPDDPDDENSRSIAYLNGLVVATLDMDGLIDAVFPATQWWDQIEDRWKEADVGSLSGRIRDEIRCALGKEALTEIFGKKNCGLEESQPTRAFVQQSARLGVVLGMFRAARSHGETRDVKSFDEAVAVLGVEEIVDRGTEAVGRVRQAYRLLAERARAATPPRDWNGAIFQVTLNRPAEPSVARSVGAVKADAARKLFSIDCSGIAWAVLDSGIDWRHPAFIDHKREQKNTARADASADGDIDAEAPVVPKERPHRIKGTFDFRRIRAVLAVNTRTKTEIGNLVQEWSSLERSAIDELLDGLIRDRGKRLPIDWRKIEPLITVATGPGAKKQVPEQAHGTHVAGIIGADWRAEDNPEETDLTGVCPDIQLYDFRILGSDLGDSEFAVSAALQFIRFYNEQGGFPRINGVNMSLAIRHNVRNYACGRTPVCLEAEALVANGVVVVAAAGNRGFQQYQLADASTFEGYAASSITDPGNAEGVITVGATHRSWPHTYGVSFFSSRGPTGDGRLKPDLLAPGEKIVSTVPGAAQDQMDGTSMAAPHVSGACALMMARHEELKGQPARIKEVLCTTATDLKRERSFQGHGMLDVLRAIQSI